MCVTDLTFNLILSVMTVIYSLIGCLIFPQNRALLFFYLYLVLIMMMIVMIQNEALNLSIIS